MRPVGLVVPWSDPPLPVPGTSRTSPGKSSPTLGTSGGCASPACCATEIPANGRGRVEVAARQAFACLVAPRVGWPLIGIDADIPLRLWPNDDRRRTSASTCCYSTWRDVLLSVFLVVWAQTFLHLPRRCCQGCICIRKLDDAAAGAWERRLLSRSAPLIGTAKFPPPWRLQKFRLVQGESR